MNLGAFAMSLGRSPCCPMITDELEIGRRLLCLENRNRDETNRSQKSDEEPG